MTDESQYCDCPMEGETADSVPRCHEITFIGERSASNKVVCSRPEGHDGPHAACSPAEHPVATWEQEGR